MATRKYRVAHLVSTQAQQILRATDDRSAYATTAFMLAPPVCVLRILPIAAATSKRMGRGLYWTGSSRATQSGRKQPHLDARNYTQ